MCKLDNEVHEMIIKSTHNEPSAEQCGEEGVGVGVRVRVNPQCVCRPGDMWHYNWK